MDDGISGILFVVFLLFSALFSSLDTALFAISPLRLKKLDEEGDKRAAAILKILSDRQRVLITILLGNTLCNVAATAIAVGLIYSHFGAEKYWAWAGSQILASVVYAAVVMTAILALFGEIIPKTVAFYGEYTFVSWTYRIMRATMFISYPIVGLIVWLIKKLLPKYSDWNEHIGGRSSLEEIDNYFDLGEEEGIIEEDEKDMINSVFEFGDTIAREVMVPRPDVTAIPINATFNDLLQCIRYDGHSRFPVYDESLDKIVGILYVKDILIRLEEIEKNYDLFKLLRSPFFVPETKKLDDLLGEFNKRKQHMAIVVDEYGGVSGLVTIEDLLEEIVGEIVDEYDVEEAEDLIKLDENTYSIAATFSIFDLEEELGCKFDSVDSDTVGGFVFEKLGRIPFKGEKFEIPQGIFQITEQKGNRILRVKFVMNKSDASSEDNSKEQ